MTLGLKSLIEHTISHYPRTTVNLEKISYSRYFDEASLAHGLSKDGMFRLPGVRKSIKPYQF